MDQNQKQYDVVVIGAGWAGSAAALSAAKRGSKVLLLERTDLILGLGLVGGIFRNNGRFSAAEEGLAMGGGNILFQVMDGCCRHVNIEFPGHKHVSLYDVTHIEGHVRRILDEYGVDVQTETRVTKVESDGHRITAVVDANGQAYRAGAFVDTTGTFGPMGNCSKHGNGCAMCIMRCHSYGPRVSIAAQAGAREYVGESAPGKYGAMGGACKLLLESLDDSVRIPLERDGVLVVHLTEEMINATKLQIKACQQYALQEFAENIIILDTGHGKLMSPFFPLNKMREIPGFERVRFFDPLAGGKANSMRFFAVAPRDDTLKVDGVANLFVGGEKSGLYVGHTEAIVTGSLAGYNADAVAKGGEPMALPVESAVGDFIHYGGEVIRTPGGTVHRFTFSGHEYFQRMKDRGTYTTDVEAIRARMRKLGLAGILN